LAFYKLSNASLEGGAEVSNLGSNDEAFAKNAIPPSTILRFRFYQSLQNARSKLHSATQIWFFSAWNRGMLPAIRWKEAHQQIALGNE